MKYVTAASTSSCESRASYIFPFLFFHWPIDYSSNTFEIHRFFTKCGEVSSLRVKPHSGSLRPHHGSEHESFFEYTIFFAGFSSLSL